MSKTSFSVDDILDPGKFTGAAQQLHAQLQLHAAAAAAAAAAAGTNPITMLRNTYIYR